MFQVFNRVDGSWLRAVLRACVLVVTAFGLELSAEQVAAVQLLIEAVLSSGTHLSSLGDTPPN
jgi:hypothetical protein